MKRKTLKRGSYFDGGTVEAFSSGCALLDLVLGPGGWAENRIANVVGDRSTGKTLLAIEACANFKRKYPKGRVVYVEAEAAFDRSYAEMLGLPEVDLVDDVFTVEALFSRLTDTIQKAKSPTLVVVDSLDALSDEAELERDITAGTYGQGKAKKLSETFRRLVKTLHNTGVTIIIVSQVRDAIGVTFGKKTRRAGGRALDFYASQVVWLAHIKRLMKTVRGAKRAAGVRVKATCEKNKVGLPFRDCEFPIYFGYGVEDLEASLEWLIENKQTAGIYDKIDDAKADLKSLPKLEREDYLALRDEVTAAVRKAWRDIDREFVSARRKYE